MSNNVVVVKAHIGVGGNDCGHFLWIVQELVFWFAEPGMNSIDSLRTPLERVLGTVLME